MQNYYWIIILFFISSCTTQQPTIINNEKETFIIKRDSIIKGSTVRDTITIDKVTNNVTIIRDSLGRTELRYFKDAYGRLVAECEAKDLTVEWLEKYVKEKKTEINTVEKKYIPWWLWIIVGILIIPAAYGIFKIII
jgi:hypothetical protein